MISGEFTFMKTDLIKQEKYKCLGWFAMFLWFV